MSTTLPVFLNLDIVVLTVPLFIGSPENFASNFRTTFWKQISSPTHNTAL